MPIEIKELVIRAVAGGEVPPRQGAASASEQPLSEAALIDECVKRVLEILERRRER